MVALKRLADALADGDRVYAVIRGSAVNNDGAAKVGFTAPSVEGQAEVIAESLMMAGVGPETIGYVEAHGSGTPLGDPIEVAALTQAFRAAGAEGEGFCALGSVKTSLGHCNTAAGAAGLIKASLALAHRTLPPSLHFQSPNPQIAFAGGPFYVPTVARPWETGGAPRRAGVSSFGLGGTNAHLVLEEAPELEPADVPSRPAQLLVLSARTASALEAAATRLADRLEANPELELADVAWTLQMGRKAFEHRRIVVARGREEAVAALRGPRAVTGRREGAAGPPVVFLFPGLGDQRAGMARELYATEPVFREQVDICAGRLSSLLGIDLREVMFSGDRPATAPAGPDLRAMLRRDAPENPGSPAEARLRRTELAQPACFVVEYALARLLMSWGIEPQAMIGYSLGEYVAACVSGILSLDGALELVARRAKLIQELPPGAMLAVPLPEGEVRPLLGEGLSLAATNGPHFCVAGGPAGPIEALDRRLGERGVSCIRLRTTHAFHSAMMDPAVEALTAIARGVAIESAAPHPLPLERHRRLDYGGQPGGSGVLGAAHAEHRPLRRGDRRAAPGARAGLPGGRPGRDARHPGQAAPGRGRPTASPSPPCAPEDAGADLAPCWRRSAACGSRASMSIGWASTAASDAGGSRCRPTPSSASATGSIRRRAVWRL